MGKFFVSVILPSFGTRYYILIHYQFNHLFIFNEKVAQSYSNTRNTKNEIYLINTHHSSDVLVALTFFNENWRKSYDKESEVQFFYHAKLLILSVINFRTSMFGSQVVIIVILTKLYAAKSGIKTVSEIGKHILITF
jgi:hypothetical protein